MSVKYLLNPVKHFQNSCHIFLNMLPLLNIFPLRPKKTPDKQTGKNLLKTLNLLSF